MTHIACAESGCWFKPIPNSDFCRTHYPRFTLTAKGWAALGHTQPEIDWLAALGFTPQQRSALAAAGYGVISGAEL